MINERLKSTQKLLSAFSLLVSSDVNRMSEKEAVEKFQELLNLDDPFILYTRNGPMFDALVKRFDFHHASTLDECSESFSDQLNPETILHLINSWMKFKTTLDYILNAKYLFYLM